MSALPFLSLCVAALFGVAVVAALGVRSGRVVYGACLAIALAAAAQALLTLPAALVGGRMPAQGASAWLTIVPTAGASSSYNGLMIGLFVVLVTVGSAKLVHVFAGRRTRRSRLWDCGYPGLGPTSQYTAASLSQPIRRVFAAVVLGSREVVDMPGPGTLRAASVTKTIHDPAWEGLFAPLGAAVGWVSMRLNRFQFLTIRHYLSLVFGLLVVLLFLIGVIA